MAHPGRPRGERGQGFARSAMRAPTTTATASS